MKLLAALFVLLALAAGPAAAGAGPGAATVKVQSSRFGPILFDGRGFVLYAFTRDPRGASKCAGARITCANDARAMDAFDSARNATT